MATVRMPQAFSQTAIRCKSAVHDPNSSTGCAARPARHRHEMTVIAHVDARGIRMHDGQSRICGMQLLRQFLALLAA
jgi:hypothetical protein